MNTQNSFKSSLNLLDATMIVMGSMIGSGIFIVHADMMRHLGSAGWITFGWLLTGLMTVVCALGFGELAALFPTAGGPYVYLKEAFNKKVAFLFGWSFFSVIQTGTIAAVGVAFAKFSGYFFDIFNQDPQNLIFQYGFLKLYYSQFLAIFLIVCLTFFNSKGVSGAKWLQTIFTVAKILALVLIIIFGFSLGFKSDIWQANWQNPFQMRHFEPSSSSWIPNISFFQGMLALTAAMVGSIFSSTAWDAISYIGEEVKNPKKNIAKSLFLGTLFVCIFYLIFNFLYLGTLSLDEIATAPQDRVGIAAAIKIFGSFGISLIAILIMISTFGCNNGLILVGARVLYSMGKDGVFFKSAAVLNKNGVPGRALWIQALVASLLCLSGAYSDLLDMVSIAVVLFFVLCTIGIFRLRVKSPQLDRPYKAFGYPFMQIFYIICGSAFCILLLIIKPTFSIAGIFIILLGIPIYYFINNNKS
ncbi:MAG: amino acid permease [Alphaproteobacteria bacterium]|nr:amino acid permease [Alphaproteobacteria bacterium]